MAAGADFRSRITVDTTQATAALKDLGTTGEQSFDKVDKGTKTATQSLKAFTKEATGMRRATGQLFKQFGDVGRSLESVGGLLGTTFGGVVGGVIGVGVGKALSGIIDSLDGVSKRLTDIRDKARGMAQAPLVLQAAQEISAGAGQGPDVGERMIAGMTEQLQKARTETKALGVEGVKVLRGMGDTANATGAHFETLGGVVGNTVKVLRGAATPVFELSKPLDTIQVSLKNMKDNSVESKKALALQLQGFLNFAKTLDPTSQKLNELSKALFQGVPAEAALKVAPKLLADLNKQIAELEKASRGATPGPLSDVERRDAAIAQRKKATDDLLAAVSNFYIKLDANATEWENKLIGETLPRWTAGFSAWFTGSLTPTLTSAWSSFIADLDQLWVANNWATLWDDFSNGFLKAADNIGAWFGGLLKRMGDTLSSWAKTAWDTLKRVGSAAGQALGGAPSLGFASGGQVPGAGSGDTVPAMLTPGEFVMRRAVVDALGAPFFAALNGGMGSFLPRTRFATGGIVAPGAAGTPVHLHIGGQQFALAGASNVVSALVVEAHRQHVRSAGVKPSWYGGR